MPQAIAFALFGLGAPLGLVNAVLGIGVAGAILHTLGPIALSVGLSYLAGALFRPSIPKPSDGQQEFQQPIPPRSFSYGRVKLAGPIAFFERSLIAALGRELYRIILLSGREIDAFEQHYLDDKLLTLDGSGLVTNQFGGLVHLFPHLGTDAQTVDTAMDAAFTEWTSAHRLRGIAYTVAAYNQGGNPEDFQFVYANGIPAYTAVIRAAKVYDPRLDSTISGGSGSHVHSNKATWTWSDNAALVVLDYLTHIDGYNRPVAKIDLQSFQAMANLCDEDVPLAAGGTENRYRFAGTVYLTEARKDVLARLLEACDAELFPTATGKIAIRGGEWVDPIVTIDADAGHIIDALFSRPSALDRYNELAVQFLSPAHGYTETECDPWQDEDDIAESGVVETRPLNLLQVPSHSQARRLAKIRMARDNPEWVGEIKTNFYGLDAIGERCITLKWPELAIDGPFYIEDATMLADGTGMSLRVRSADPASYNWDEDTEEGEAPPVPPDISGDGGIG